jgi:hypothetical protein
MALIIIGAILIFLQVLALIGSLYAGGLDFFVNVTNFDRFIYELICFLSYSAVGIAGVIFLTIGICKKAKKSHTNTQNNKKASLTMFRKPYGFLQNYKKLFLVLITVSFILLLVFILIVAFLNNLLDDAVAHYQSTLKHLSGGYTDFGCGSYSCRYCEGLKNKINTYANYAEPQSFRYYSDIYNKRSFFEGCASVFLILTILLAGIFLAILITNKVQHYKKILKTEYQSQNNSLNDDTEVENQSRRATKKFCKYCGARIDEDSLFCSSCGKSMN